MRWRGSSAWRPGDGAHRSDALERIGRPRPLRILVAEDNPVNRKLVTTLLQKRGHDVKAVENGRAGRRGDASQRRSAGSTSC